MCLAWAQKLRSIRRGELSSQDSSSDGAFRASSLPGTLSLSLCYFWWCLCKYIHLQAVSKEELAGDWEGQTDVGCVCLLPQGMLRCSRARCEAGDVDENSAIHLAIKVA